jgi:hypothetical protein
MKTHINTMLAVLIYGDWEAVFTVLGLMGVREILWAQRV